MMKINAFDVYAYELAYAHGDYGLSQGRVTAGQMGLVVKIGTDAGLVGWGETCFLGRTQLPAYFESERAALAILAEAVIGLDPRQNGVLQSVMAATVLSGMAAKSAIDIACWDIIGKAAGVPISTLLGGRQQERVRVWDTVPIMKPDAAREQVERSLARGVLDFQVKVGDDPFEDTERVAAVLSVVSSNNLVVADANGGWTLRDALIAARLMANFEISLEQPCRSFADCAEVARHAPFAIIVDECVGGVEDLIRAKHEIGASGVNVKPSRVGGLTKASLVRDVATELGMTVTVDDTWGGALTTAALSHLAISTAPSALLATTFFSAFATPMIADVPHRQGDGHGTASMRPGLGCEIDETMIGEAILRFR